MNPRKVCPGLLLLLGLSGLPAAAATRTAVLLVGYSTDNGRYGLPVLSRVGDDLLRMEAFFELLEPELVLLHLEQRPHGVTPDSDRRRVRPPEFAALLESVAEIRRRWAAPPPPGERRQIYLFWAGHGKSDTTLVRPRTELFLRPAPQKSLSGLPGYDGRLDGPLFDEALLGPLEEVAERVHVIVDACQSLYLLNRGDQERSGRIRKYPEPREGPVLAAFAARRPRVGVLLATNGSRNTYEDPEVGGLFSYALRSAGIGQAEALEDGILTYGEMAMTLGVILDPQGVGQMEPVVQGPGRDPSAAFLDFRDRPAVARVRVQLREDSLKARLYRNLDQTAPFALFHVHPQDPVTLYLRRGEEYVYMSFSQDRELRPPMSFRAADGDLLSQAQPERVAQVRGRGVAWNLLPRPFGPAEHQRLLAAPQATSLPSSSVAAYWTGGGGLEVWQVVEGPAGLGTLLGPTVWAFWGRRSWQARVAAHLALANSVQDGGGQEALRYEARFYALELAGSYLLVTRPLELGLGLNLGGGLATQRLQDLVDRSNSTLLMLGAVQVRGTWPLPGFERLGVVVQGTAGVQQLFTDGWEISSATWSPLLTGTVGLELEGSLP